jgi:hypothetical protein
LVPKYYPTTEPAESGIFRSRDVPRELLNFVHHTKINNRGASGRQAQIKATLPEGTKELAAQRSFKQAATYVRLTNNLEIDVEVLHSLVTQVGSLVSQIESIKEVPILAKAKLLQVAQKVRLLDNTVFDVRSTNAQLLLFRKVLLQN